MNTQVMVRKNWWTIALAAVAAVLAIVMALSVQPASASDGYFDLSVRHGINGNSLRLGLDKELPVDVYVNDAYQFTFSFKDRVSTSLPAGNYKIDVKIAGTDTTVMSLGPTDIPAGVDVDIKAKLSANKTPILKVKIK